MSQTDGKMQGWLHNIGYNRFGLQFSRKRYFILHENTLKSFKSIPFSDNEEPVRSAILDSYIRVTDDGRESIHRKVFFIFTLYNSLNSNDQLKLGASSSEEAAKWIRSLQDVASKEYPCLADNLMASSNEGWAPLRLSVNKRRSRVTSIDWTNRSSIHTEPTTADVIAPSPWKIFGCQNGLRLFKEAKDWDSRGRHWDDNPAIMAVGVVDGTSEAIFRTLMSVGPSRSEWDFCFYRGSVVEHLDGHTDIVHKELYSDWLPWGMKRRDLLLRRYWRREDDGTYVILYHSVYHKKCEPQKGYIRVWLKSGGYVVSPVNQGKQSLVKHMLSIDWKFWKSYLNPSSARSTTISMLERVAALRELFQARSGNFSSEDSSGELMRGIGVVQTDKIDIKKNEIQELEKIVRMEENFGLVIDEQNKTTPGRTSLMGLNDTSDEFFDVLEATEYDHYENGWSCATSPEIHPQGIHHSKLSSASVLVKKLHDLAVHKKGYMDLQEVSKEDGFSFCYGATLQNDPTCTLPCSWADGDPSSFLIRGETYLKDHKKMKANNTLMQMVGVDWLISEKREDNLGSRPNSIVQKSAARGGNEFFFIVNIQIPGATMHTLALYYMMKTPVEGNPALHKFINGDDAYRNSRFKLIPYISKGSWIVKQSVGKKACLVGQALESLYFRGKNYFELEIDVGSSTVARGVVSLVLGYLNNLVIELAFVIQGNSQDELPELLLGTCRINNLDSLKSLRVPPSSSSS